MPETETLTLGYSTVNPLVVWLSDLVPELPYRGNRTAPPPIQTLSVQWTKVWLNWRFGEEGECYSLRCVASSGVLLCSGSGILCPGTVQMILEARKGDSSFWL